MGKYTQVVKEQKVDGKTGEVIEEHKIEVMRTDREPDYVKMYLNDLVKLNDLPASGSSVLFWILKRIGYDNKVVLVHGIKKAIAKEIGTSINTVIRRIQDLKDKKILIATDERSIFLVNPNLFARGKWEDVKKIRLSIQYGTEGKVMKAEFDRQQEIEFKEEEK